MAPHAGKQYAKLNAKLHIPCISSNINRGTGATMINALGWEQQTLKK